MPMPSNRSPLGRDLYSALDALWSKNDAISCVATIAVQLVNVFRAVGSERAVYSCIMALEVAFLLLPPAYRRRLRAPLVFLLRVGILLIIPLKVDLLRIMQPDAAHRKPSSDSSSRSGLAWSLAALHSLSTHVRGAVMLIFPLAWLHAYLGTALGWQLPPLPHVLLHIASILLLQRRTPAVCQQFLERHPSNTRVVAAAYYVLEQLTMLVALGASTHLDAASQSKSTCQKCTVVVWVLRVSLGLVLPTLMVWRAQLDAAVEHTRRRREQCQQRLEERLAERRRNASRTQQGGRREVQEAAAAVMEAEAELQRSQYWRVCRPVLLSLEWYGWWVAVLLSAVLSFVGAVLWQERFGAAPAA